MSEANEFTETIELNGVSAYIYVSPIDGKMGVQIDTNPDDPEVSGRPDIRVFVNDGKVYSA